MDTRTRETVAPPEPEHRSGEVEHEQIHEHTARKTRPTGEEHRSATAVPRTAVSKAAMASPKSETLQEIETILAEDLSAVYSDLSKPERQAFKVRGEETAKQVRILLQQASVRVREIFELIVGWLRTLPGVSWPFIEQEAKIKTDKLMRLRRRKRS